jgi:sigma-B regulation protein RsbU (phosphoserine phosphatase)
MNMLADDLIRCMPLFEMLPEEELAELARGVQIKEIHKGTLLFREGYQEEQYFILIDGEVEVIKAMDTPDERLLAIREPCSFLGELSLFSDDGTHTASVRAYTDLELMEVPRSTLDNLLKNQPAFAYEMIRTLSTRLVDAEDLTIRDLRQKNRALLKAYEDLEAAQAQIIEKERMERELEVARQIQMSILPRVLPLREGYDFGARIVPMTAVGGDFFDFIPLEEDKLGIAIGDVSDHGVPAALFMAMTMTLLRAEARRTLNPVEVLINANRQLLETNALGMFVTVLYAVLDLKSGELHFGRAGHELPILLDASANNLEVSRALGQPLGLFIDPQIDEKIMRIPPEGVLVLYTDGVTDAINPDAKLFGLEELITVLKDETPASAQSICDSVWKALERYRGTRDQLDDITLIALRSLSE